MSALETEEFKVLDREFKRRLTNKLTALRFRTTGDPEETEAEKKRAISEYKEWYQRVMQPTKDANRAKVLRRHGLSPATGEAQPGSKASEGQPGADGRV